MIEKILERLEAEADKSYHAFAVGFISDDMARYSAYKHAKEIVQEVAKEYGKDTNLSNGWIPVETELPKEHLWAGHMISEEVFVTFLDNNEKLRVDTDNTYDGKWHYYGDRVIAWMPKKLPAPYQKGE